MNRTTVNLRGAGGFSKSPQPYFFSKYPKDQTASKTPKTRPFVVHEECTQPQQLIVSPVTSSTNDNDTHQFLGKGIIRDGTGFVTFPVKYLCVVFRPFKGEILEAIVTMMGFFAEAGPVKIFVSNHVSNVIPSTLKIIKPNREFSISLNMSTSVEYGRVVLVTDKGFCKDAARNQFTRTKASWFLVHFDRRDVYVDLRTRIDSNTRTTTSTQ
ncbi:DNA-directed RNA polymerase II subunit RPB7 [Artemisia annua]|uniref:DNA-directed RNA polymerase II subunit RPB7 n=1 Tax=Artemisia annua TaxID=35608 RepID=A0A2U1LZZ9_ARTAN|nr:DNA-directed RNA polymerase II subunit RPB7 [Artemisia annua]